VISDATSYDGVDELEKGSRLAARLILFVFRKSRISRGSAVSAGTGPSFEECDLSLDGPRRKIKASIE
jgi:hypothetical protein